MKNLLSLILVLSAAAFAQSGLATFIGPAAGTTLPVGSTPTFTWTANTMPVPPAPSPAYFLCFNITAFDASGFCSAPGSIYGPAPRPTDLSLAMQVIDPGDNNPLYVTFCQRVYDGDPTSPTYGWHYASTYLLYPTTPAVVTVITDTGGTGNPVTTTTDYSDPTDPSPVAMYPNSGSGQTQSFNFLVTDEAGWQDIGYITIEIGDTTCQVNWVASGLFVGFSNPTPLGSNQVFHAQNCDILNSQSSASVQGNDVSLTLDYVFSSSWAGTQNVYVNVTSRSGLPTPGFVLMGTWTPNPSLGTDMYKTFHTTHGEAVRIKRGDVYKDPPKVKYSYSSGAGSSSYTYEFNNHEVAHMRLGIMPEDTTIGQTGTSEPEGWINLGPGWDRWKGATSSKTAQYTVTSAKMPGLLPLFLQTDWDGTAAAINGDPVPADSGFTGLLKPPARGDGAKMNAQINIFANSLQRMVIGPAFDPDSTLETIMTRVRIWARTKNGYGFTFLQPLIDAKDPKSALDSLTPATQLERDVVSCLRTVFAGAKNGGVK
jgi:hypothetical protein